jgi:predicted RNA-binding Zn ribbon-like protein
MVAQANIDAESFYFLGGRPALDLVNTLRERGGEGVEYLVVPEDVLTWTMRTGLLAPDAPLDPAEAEALWPEVHTLREAIYTAAAAWVAGAPVPLAALHTINAWLDQPRERPHLLPGKDGPVLTTQALHTASLSRLTLVWGADGPMLTAQPAISPLRAAFVLVAEDAARLLGTTDRDRIRICANPQCRAVFYDRSQAGRRRWCDMTRCGNVAKVQRYRQRLRMVGTD